MKRYGVRGIVHDWFTSYLCDRKQYVSINSNKSTYKSITHGVPQGSVLGPLLFLIYINDIIKSTTFFKFILFADDSTLSACIPKASPDTVANMINTELNHLSDWLKANKISINAEKTHYIIFTYKQSPELPLIKIGEDRISETDSTKFLGITIDKHLTFKNHISLLTSKLSKSVGILNKLNKIFPTKVLHLLYQTLVLPYIRYGIEAWYGSYQNTNQKIFVIQKKAIRAVNNLDYNSHTTAFFKDMTALKLADIYNLQIATFMHKLLYDKSDPELENILVCSSNLHDYHTRNNNKLIIPRCNRNKSKFGIHYRGTKVWNSLPENIRETQNLRKFNKLLKLQLLETY